jgi:actin-related protein
MSYPVQQGRIVDFDNMQKIWEHLFSQELKV